MDAHTCALWEVTWALLTSMKCSVDFTNLISTNSAEYEQRLSLSSGFDWPNSFGRINWNSFENEGENAGENNF
jgi:hypothetical protein